jgi:hypothetical protein
VALERPAEDAHGDLVYTCTKPWSDGTTGMTLSPLEPIFAFDEAHDIARGPIGDVRAAARCLTPLRHCMPVCNPPQLSKPGRPETLA